MHFLAVGGFAKKLSQSKLPFKSISQFVEKVAEPSYSLR
jgi:hypothetical protein